MEKDPKKLGQDPGIQDLVDDKRREDADRKALKVDIGRTDGKNQGAIEAEAAYAVKAGGAVKAIAKGQYPASGPIREPGDIFRLEDDAHFSENWMTRDLKADLEEAQATLAETKRLRERNERRAKQGLPPEEASGRTHRKAAVVEKVAHKSKSEDKDVI